MPAVRLLIVVITAALMLTVAVFVATHAKLVKFATTAISRFLCGRSQEGAAYALRPGAPVAFELNTSRPVMRAGTNRLISVRYLLGSDHLIGKPALALPAPIQVTRRKLSIAGPSNLANTGLHGY